MLPSIYAQPRDLTTDYDGMIGTIGVYSWSESIPDLSQSLSLRTYPADQLVAASVALEELDIGGHKAPGYFLHPTEPLVAGWYALVLEHRNMTNAHVRADGASEVRFRVGSQPLIVSVGACASSDLALMPKLRVEFSEQVSLPAADVPIEAVVGEQPAACVLYDPTPLADAAAIGLTCTPPIPAAASLTVTIRPGLIASSSGLALGTLRGELPQMFELPIQKGADPCRSWHETEAP